MLWVYVRFYLVIIYAAQNDFLSFLSADICHIKRIHPFVKMTV